MKMLTLPVNGAQKGIDGYLIRQQVKLVHTIIESDECEEYLIGCVLLCQLLKKPILPVIENDG
jgi:hypothetical protein